MKEFLWVMTKNYANLRGRAGRREYWMYTLVVFLLGVFFAIIETVLGLNKDGTYGPFSGLLTLVTLVPTFAVGVRRMHDIGRSGWWVLTSLIPIWFLVLACFESKPGTNQWGPNPKGQAAPAPNTW